MGTGNVFEEKKEEEDGDDDRRGDEDVFKFTLTFEIGGRLFELTVDLFKLVSVFAGGHGYYYKGRRQKGGGLSG